MNVNEILEEKEEAFDKWFYRWYKKQALDSRIKVAARQGYTGINIAVSKENDDYTRRRLNNPEVIKKLKKELTGFDIDYVESSGDTKLFNTVVGKWYKKVISISWLGVK